MENIGFITTKCDCGWKAYPGCIIPCDKDLSDQACPQCGAKLGIVFEKRNANMRSFDEWYESLPCDEQAALCSYDVWKGALSTAIEELKKDPFAEAYDCIATLEKGLKD